MSASPPSDLLAFQLRIAALEAEASQFQRFARDAPIGILFVATDGRAQFANDEYLRIAGRTRAEFEVERFRLDRSAVPPWLNAARGSRHEAEHVRPDGTRVPILVGVSRQQEGIAAFVIDLTVEKAAQRAREESEERSRAIAEKLAEADRRKDEFLGVLSHELRNPLAPIRNALHLLVNAGGDAARATRAREVIERQVTHLSRLVDDLLDVTRITKGGIELHRAPIDLAVLVRDTAEDHRAVLEAAGVQLDLRLPPAPVPVDGDPTRLAQVLGNVLSNSAKFTPCGGTVTVQLEEDAAGLAVLHVRDTGEGIEPAVLARLFEPFAQADRTLARSRGGLGLGLAVVKGLVELHGGTVTVSSGGRGAGSEVALRLPRIAPPQQPPGPRVAAARSARVVVIEDNVDAAETLREALELEGMTVAVAGDGSAGIGEVRRMRPDVVICDIGLPGDLDGYQVARAVRADPATCAIPLLALTGYAAPEDRARAREAGFDRHLAKPIALVDLLHAIDAVLAGGVEGGSEGDEP